MRRFILNSKKNRTISNKLNQSEEIVYFNAYLLPLSEKANIQTALDTYGAVRLEKGDYRGVNITLKSNQRLYGHSTLTRISHVLIKGGSTNIHLEDLLMQESRLEFETTDVISNCTFKSIKWADIKANNVMLENNTFVNLLSNLTIDCSVSGYFRNNRIIKQQVGYFKSLVLKGNFSTPSYGNVNLWLNFLNSSGDATDISNLKTATFVGLDAEAWNYDGSGTKAMLKITGSEVVKVTDMGGGNDYSPVRTAPFDIDADDLFFFNKQLYGGNAIGEVSVSTNIIQIGGIQGWVRESGTATGFGITAQQQNGTYPKDILYNDVLQSTAITEPIIKSNITNSILGKKHTPWARPNWETLPDPLGANWRAERVGKPDSRAYIQNLIDTKKIAQLPEGVFYISSTLYVKGNGQGITGLGIGKTVIVGITDDFPLITMVTSTEGTDYVLSHLTLQGGSIGQFFPENYRGTLFVNIKYVVFRDQNIGMHLYKMGGTDNCFFDSVSFVNCGTGFFQEPKELVAPDFDMSGYVDKVVFYNSQYINCGTAFSMYAIRANNLNAWINCKFDGNDIALDTRRSNFPIIANCDFTNNNGEIIFEADEISMYNCNFYNNSPSKAISRATYSYFEGCNLLDNAPLGTWRHLQNSNVFVANSTITGNVTVTDRPINEYGQNNAVYSNSLLLANPTLSKLLVNIKDGVPTVLIDETPNPYPQLLVTQ